MEIMNAWDGAGYWAIISTCFWYYTLKKCKTVFDDFFNWFSYVRIRKRIHLNVLPSPSKQWKKWILGEVVVNSIRPRKRFHPPYNVFTQHFSQKKHGHLDSFNHLSVAAVSPLKGDRRQGHRGVCFARWSCGTEGHRDMPGGGGWVRPRKDGSSKKPLVFVSFFGGVLFCKCMEWMDPQYTWWFLEMYFSFEDEFRVHHLLTWVVNNQSIPVFCGVWCLGITLHTCISIETKGVLFTFKKDAYGVMEGATHSAQRLATIRDKELRVECRGEGSVRCGGLPRLPSLAKAPEN